MAVKEITIQGVHFKIKPNCPANVRPIEEYRREQTERAREFLALMDRVEDEMALPESERTINLDEIEPPEIDEIWVRLRKEFEMVTEGDHSKLDYEQVDADTLQEVVDRFLPSWMRIGKPLSN